MAKYEVNENYFDTIDTEDKAYWLGFIWCDGYLGIRNREGRGTEYTLRLTTAPIDASHLHKFRKCICSTHPVTEYKYSENTTSFSTGSYYRISITNKHLGKTLNEKYNMKAGRNSITDVVSSIPTNLVSHFIRGVIDADGSIVVYKTQDRGRLTDKMCLSMYTNVLLNSWIEDQFIKNELCANIKRKMRKRHEGRDGNAIRLSFGGVKQCLKILEFVYKDSTIFLDRKRKKYVDKLREVSELSYKKENLK